MPTKQMRRSTRRLTREEMDYITDFLVPQKGIPEEMGDAIIQRHKAAVNAQLAKVEINENVGDCINKIKRVLADSYFQSLATAGDSVGIICAQSIGEKNTQSTLNSFHKAGQSEKTITTSVPRFQELLNATRDLKNLSCKVALIEEEGSDDIARIRLRASKSLVHVTFGKLIGEVRVTRSDDNEIPWMDIYNSVFESSDFFGRIRSNHTVRICVVLKRQFIFENSIDLSDIARAFHYHYDTSEILCVFSPTHIAQVDLFVDIDAIAARFGDASILPPEVYAEDVLIERLRHMHVSGVKDVNALYYFHAKKDNTWEIETEGGNFLDVASADGVDPFNTTTNDIWGIFDVLGVEATRALLLQEFAEIMGDVNVCHCMLLVDRMTFAGKIESISRYTMRKDEAGPLSKSTFEESMDIILKAASNADIETTNGVSAAIICGKKVNVGTGMMDICVDFEKLTTI